MPFCTSERLEGVISTGLTVCYAFTTGSVNYEVRSHGVLTVFCIDGYILTNRPVTNSLIFLWRYFLFYDAMVR